MDRLAGRGDVMDPLLDRPLTGDAEPKVEWEVTWRNLVGFGPVIEAFLGARRGDVGGEVDKFAVNEEEDADAIG